MSSAGCLGLSLVISAQFTFDMCVAAWNRKNALKPPIFAVQSRLRSSMSVPPERSSAVLVMINSKSVPICNRSHARWANSGKKDFLGGTPLWCPRLRGISSPSGTKFGHKNFRIPLRFVLRLRPRIVYGAFTVLKFAPFVIVFGDICKRLQEKSMLTEN